MLMAILVSCAFISIMKVEAGKEIGYPAIGFGDDPHGCDPKYPATCIPKPEVNPYTRGCKTSTRCHRGDSPPALSNNI